MPSKDSSLLNSSCSTYIHFTNSRNFSISTCQTALSDLKCKKITRSNSVGFTCNTSAQDIYVMLVFNHWLFFIFKLPKKSLRAKVDRLNAVTQNICVILSGYLSVFGLCFPFSLLPAFAGFPSVLQRCFRSGVFKAAALGVRLGFHFGLRFRESLLALSSGSTAEIPWPREECHCGGRGITGRALPLTVAFTELGSSI